MNNLCHKHYCTNPLWHLWPRSYTWYCSMGLLSPGCELFMRSAVKLLLYQSSSWTSCKSENVKSFRLIFWKIIKVGNWIIWLFLEKKANEILLQDNGLQMVVNVVTLTVTDVSVINNFLKVSRKVTNVTKIMEVFHFLRKLKAWLY